MCLHPWLGSILHHRDKKKIKNLKRKDQGFVTYGDNNKGKIIGIGDVGGGDTLEIKDVLLVEGLKYLIQSCLQHLMFVPLVLFHCTKTLFLNIEVECSNNNLILDVCGQ